MPISLHRHFIIASRVGGGLGLVMLLRLGFHFPHVRRLREVGGRLKTGGERRSGVVSKVGEKRAREKSLSRP
jgi:hypothetical protein